jgi:protein-tyrosine phosphatase
VAIAVTHVEVEPEGEGALVVRWVLEDEGKPAPEGVPGTAVEVAVGPTPEAVDHAGAVAVGEDRREVRLTGLAPGRYYASVAPRAGGSAVVAGERRVPFKGVTNFRDLGGYPAGDGGRTRWGVVFRADALHRFTDADLAAYRRLGVRAVVDLRGDAERERAPNPVASHQLALLDANPVGPRPDPGALRERIDGERQLALSYRRMLDNAGPLFGRLLTGLAQPDGLPAVFHCTGGKDRTGMTAALLLTWLGVPRQTVLDDYELTARWRTLEHQGDTLRMLLATGMAHDAALGFLGAPRWVMAEALEALDAEHGGIEAYLRGPGRMREDTLAALRSVLVVPA